ncbi:MAG: mechanosensitive ion channel domain-containing protein [Rhodocyclaceae bacterium]
MKIPALTGRQGRQAPHGFTVFAALVLVGLSLSVFAQVPGLPGLPGQTKEPQAQAAKPPSEKEFLERVQSQLNEDRATLERLDAPGGIAEGAPAATDPRELQDRRWSTAIIVRSLEQQIDDLAKLAEARKRRSASEAALKAWSGFDTPAPYSILLVDALRDQQLSAETALTALESREKVIQQFNERIVDNLKQAETQLRQLDEATEKPKGTAEAERLAWRRDLARLQVRADQTILSGLESTRQYIEEEISDAKLRIALLKKKRDVASARFHFKADDLERIHAALDAERRDTDRETALAEQEYARRRQAADSGRQALDATRKRLAAARPASTQRIAEELQPLERAADLLAEQSETAGSVLENLRQSGDTIRIRQALWEARFRAYGEPTAATRLDAIQAVRRTQAYLGSLKKYLAQQVAVLDARMKDVDIRLSREPEETEEKHLRSLQKTFVDRAAGFRRTSAVLDATDLLAERMLAEFDEKRDQQSLKDRAEDQWIIAGRTLRAVWNYELLAVEDTIQVDGRTITGTRSVTVGKVCIAIVLFLIGVAASLYLARYGERVAVRRFGKEAAQARTVRRWVLVLALILLFFAILAWVKIPLTIFAFLGGAVAIGVGFGMQNMLKNLISGLMILGERPFRPGDVLQVASVSGTVTNIGLRASTLRDVNGIETIIPNSTFIEQNLTNWTLTSAKVRFGVKVGVAYGSPVRLVTQLLNEVVDRHGKILKDPKPEILFEDFGPDSLMFGVYYWLNLASSDVASRQVASDVRRMIETRFSESGIALPFPQRDVHLDSARPLPVQIVAAPEPAKAPAPGSLPGKPEEPVAAASDQ